MKYGTFFLFCLALGFSAASSAELINRGNGLIYDTVLNITWLQDASFGAGSAFDDAEDPLREPETTVDGKMSWLSAMAWVENLTIGNASGWRLPSMDKNGDQATLGDDGIVNCATSSELECRDNEMGHLFFHHLNGEVNGDYLGNEGPFINVKYTSWSSTLYNSGWAWGYVFGDPQYDTINGSIEGVYIGAWAVHDGDVALEYSSVSINRIPIPSLAVFAFGLSCLGIAVGFIYRD